jgi:solute carrier family 35 protein E1
MKLLRVLSLLLLPPAAAAAAASSVSSSKAAAFQPTSRTTSSLTKPTASEVGVRGGSSAAVGVAVPSAVVQRLQVGGYFGLWYLLNVWYNIINKKLLNLLPLPYSVGALQFGVGALYVGAMWQSGARQRPARNPKLKQVGLCHMTGQLASMVSLGAGPVSFTHIVKALEPFFSAIVSAIYFGKFLPWQVYMTLLPVVGGVGYACLKERSFSWLAFWMAMASNLAFALRAVLSKVAMTPNTSPANIFGIVTQYAFAQSIPIALIAEGGSFLTKWQNANASTSTLIQSIIISGMFHYLNNEVMYLALNKVHPVTLAVGNTMKRVFIMVASVIVFRNTVSLQAGIGSAVGIGGVLLYSLTKQHYEAKSK